MAEKIDNKKVTIIFREKGTKRVTGKAYDVPKNEVEDYVKKSKHIEKMKKLLKIDVVYDIK